MFCSGPDGGSLRLRAPELRSRCCSFPVTVLEQRFEGSAPPARVMERSRRLWRPGVFQCFDPLLVLQFCRGHAKGATWTLVCASESPLSISREAWEDTCEAELCPLCGCGKRKRNPQIIYERQIAKKCKILAQKLQAR